MGLGNRILGFVSAPFVGARNTPNHYNQQGFSGSCEHDDLPVTHFNAPQTAQLVPMERMVNTVGTLADRSSGTYTLIPGRALSAQTRLKNMSWELPSAVWTENPEGPAYIPRVPGLPNVVHNMPTINNFTTQPEFLQPITNLQIQNDINWLNQFRSAIFGAAAQKAQDQLSQNQQTMFPSIYGSSISSDLGSLIGGAE